MELVIVGYVMLAKTVVFNGKFYY